MPTTFHRQMLGMQHVISNGAGPEMSIAEMETDLFTSFRAAVTEALLIAITAAMVIALTVSLPSASPI